MMGVDEIVAALECFEFFGDEVGSIVRDNFIRDAVSHEVCFQLTDNSLRRCGSEAVYLEETGEIVHRHKVVLLL